MYYPEKKHPDHLDNTVAAVLDRAQVALTHPQIENLRAEAMEYQEEICDKRPTSLGVVYDTKLLRPLLEPHWHSQDLPADDVGPLTLVLYLPSYFGWPVVGKMAAQSPYCRNAPLLDLQCTTTYLTWDVQIPGEAQPTMVQVAVLSGIQGALNAAHRYPTHNWGWMPIVIVADNTVAVGGFVVDALMMDGLQAASMSAQSHCPEELYSKEEIRQAGERAAKDGTSPWVNDRWPGEQYWTIEPEVLIYQV
jgi:hypothetical protein